MEKLSLGNLCNDQRYEMKHQTNPDVLAVVIHAFYVDVFSDIIQSLKGLSVPIKIYVTTISEHESEINQILISSGFDFYLLSVANRGRDVLPFLRIMPKVIQNDHVVVLKLHTKKTEHRIDGAVWMDDILSKLVAKNKVDRYFDLIKNNNNIGIIAPAGHIVSMSAYCGSNKKNVLRISKRLGFCKSDVMREMFVAGTMFYAHVSALKPMIELALTDDDFEVENNQVDGTLAHAIERCFSISSLSANLKLISSDSVNVGASQVVHDDYAYADATSYSKYASVASIVSFYLLKVKKLVIKIKNMMLR